MPYITLASGLTIKVPTKSTTDWDTTMKNDTFQKISEHDHTGSGKGTPISSAALAADSVTDLKILLSNDAYLRGRNAADSADINMIKVDTSDYLELGALLRVRDSLFSVVDEGDITKQLIFSLAAATTAKTITFASAHTDDRTLTLPDATDTLLGRATTDTLTNKSINSDNNTITNIVDADIKAGANIAASKLAPILTTNGDIEYYNSGRQRLPKGTNGQVLVLAGGLPSWAANVSVPLTVSTKSADYIILDGDGIGTILVDDTSSDRTVTLPTASANGDRVITIKNTSTDKGKVTVDGEGAETIDGRATIDLDFKDSFITLTCDASGWSISATNLTGTHKQYSLTAAVASWTTTRAVGRPYRDLDGNWFISINVKGTTPSFTGISPVITGITTSNSAALTARTTATDWAIAYFSTATIVGRSGTATTEWHFAGDIELDSKPTFVE